MDGTGGEDDLVGVDVALTGGPIRKPEHTADTRCLTVAVSDSHHLAAGQDLQAAAKFGISLAALVGPP